MTHIGAKKVIIPVCAFLIVLFLPQLINAILIYVQAKNGTNTIYTLDLEYWYDIAAIAFPCGLTYMVLRQSEQQQKENRDLQERMEHLNERMLNSELKTHIGYFLPEINETIAGRRNIPVRHNLHNGIGLIHAGDDIVFVMRSVCYHGGKEDASSQGEPVCYLNQPSLRKYCVDCVFDESELKAPQVDVVIELFLQNSKGYQYKQTIDFGFENDNEAWTINRFNMRIEEAPADAD